MAIYAPFAKPLYVMLKPAGSTCNLACTYCYYMEKAGLYNQASRQTMSDELLEAFVKAYLQAQTMPQVLFTWHGGEPLMRPLAFYKRAVELQRIHAKGRAVDNCIQTNGILLNDEWCRFFKENNWLVGISIDGPQHLHDRYRRNKQGSPSFAKVMQGVRLLQKHGVEWNGMAVVNNCNAAHPVEFYRFFKEIGCRYLQFAPIVERFAPHPGGGSLCLPEEEGEAIRLAPFSVTPEQWGGFLCAVFDEWVKEDVGTYFVQLFDATLANWVGEPPGVCTLAPTCGQVGVMEFNGDVYACDHFVFPPYKLGNIRQQSLVEMMYGERQQAFGRRKQTSLPAQCRQCEWLFACNGECPKNRFARTAGNDPGLNYLCEGYRKFFRHVAPYMDFMKEELRHQRPPANVMQAAGSIRQRHPSP